MNPMSPTKTHHRRKVIRAYTLPCRFRAEFLGFVAEVGRSAATRRSIYFQGGEAHLAVKDCFTRDCAPILGLPAGRGRILADYFA